jgi:hypothetical protein
VTTTNACVAAALVLALCIQLLGLPPPLGLQDDIDVERVALWHSDWATDAMYQIDDTASIVRTTPMSIGTIRFKGLIEAEDAL